MPLLVNTAIAVNDDPCRMARAFAQAVEAGRMAYEIGLGSTHATAQATSPLTAFWMSKTLPISTRKKPDAHWRPRAAC